MVPMNHKLAMTPSHEWVGHDPFGNIKPGDDTGSPPVMLDNKGVVNLTAARNGYASFRVMVQGEGDFQLSASVGQNLEIDLFKAWYHKVPGAGETPATYWPDALVPFSPRTAHSIPCPDNRVPGQTAQEFWVDVYVPKDAAVGDVSGSIRLRVGTTVEHLRFKVHVAEAILPDDPTVTLDYNSYGFGRMHQEYPKSLSAKYGTDRHFAQATEQLHHQYRLVHEHRALFHNLGYGHSGLFEPIYGPRKEGHGYASKLVDWDTFDDHYGPLLDGSAFAKAAPGAPRPRRLANPIWGVYTPINPGWPADYSKWGQKGYEAEFTTCLRQFDEHLQQKGWTQSRIEFFFNHKKRHRWFDWDGDEPKYAKDMGHHLEMIRMWESVITDSPVNWVYRMDASWQMKAQFDKIGGHRNFWVCSGFHRWYPELLRKVVERGDITWFYGGAPPVNAPSSAGLARAYETWARGLSGFCHWCANSPGDDPWFNCVGSSTGMLYPGERFGIRGPIASVRMKVLRNGIQDIDLLDNKTRQQANARQVRDELADAIPIMIWEKPHPVSLELPPEEWDSFNLQEEHEPIFEDKKGLGAMWWKEIRDRVS